MTDSPVPTTLEQALDALERDADSSLRALLAAVKEAKRLKAAAATGQLRDVQQAFDAVDALGRGCGRLRPRAAGRLAFDEQATSSPARYTKEVLARGRRAGLDAFESDDRILSYPAIVPLSPADATVLIDKRKERRVRPSVLVRHARCAAGATTEVQARGVPRGARHAYDLVVAARGQPGATVKLTDVYNVLTVLPGAGPRLQPPGVRPRPVPARPERRHHHQGRARAAAAGQRPHPRLAACCARSPGPGRRRCTPASLRRRPP